ncbi:MAG: S1C family serine protease [Synechococcus sp.]|nr:S1C family serine protease [Synechococcus sp.]
MGTAKHRCSRALTLGAGLLLALGSLAACVPVLRRSPGGEAKQTEAARPAAAAPAPQCGEQGYAPEALFRRAQPAVAVVETSDTEGSAFVVRQQGGTTLLLTNAHVLNGAESAALRWADGSRDTATVLARADGESPLTDLALLEVRGQRGQVLPLKSTPVAVGSDIVAIGAPQGLEFSLSRGVVSSLREQGQLLQIDAAINPGNSGGPVLDSSGCVVGMATFKLRNSEGLNFAIASAVMEAFLNRPPSAEATGEIGAGATKQAEEAEAADPGSPGEPTCWFQQTPNAEELLPARCRVVARTNANGDKVFDLIEPGGLTRTVVLWDDDSAEVFLGGTRYLGRWGIDSDGDVRVSLEGGSFAFRQPRIR